MRGPAKAWRDAHAIAERRSSRLEQVENDLRETQSKLSEVLPKLVATREQLEHSQVRAPASGEVVGLRCSRLVASSPLGRS